MTEPAPRGGSSVGALKGVRAPGGSRCEALAPLLLPPPARVSQVYPRRMSAGEPERLLDGDLGHAVDLDRAEHRPSCCAETPRPAAVAPNSRPTGRASSAITSVPGGQLARPALQPLAASARPDARRTVEPVRIEGAQRHARLDDRDRERVVEQALAGEAALLHPLQDQRLDRGRLLVRIEADVAVEDPVGPGDRLVAQVDRLRAREAVGELAQALLDRGRAATRARARPAGTEGRGPGTPRAAPERSGPPLRRARSSVPALVGAIGQQLSTRSR